MPLHEKIKMPDKIRVAVIFLPGGKIKPVWFDRQGIKYEIKEICSVWSSREGAAKIIHFSVNDGCDTYELKYNSSDYNWSLSVAVCS